MVGTALMGKTAIYVYRTVKGSTNVATKVGQFYKGGFELTMTRREAGLILGVGS